jgi:hypothetical protein
MLLQNYYDCVLKFTNIHISGIGFLMYGFETTGEYHAHLIVCKKIETSENINNFVREK